MDCDEIIKCFLQTYSISYYRNSAFFQTNQSSTNSAILMKIKHLYHYQPFSCSNQNFNVKFKLFRTCNLIPLLDSTENQPNKILFARAVKENVIQASHPRTHISHSSPCRTSTSKVIKCVFFLNPLSPQLTDRIRKAPKRPCAMGYVLLVFCRLGIIELIQRCNLKSPCLKSLISAVAGILCIA